MNQDKSHFELFGLPQRFALDADELERAYRRVQEQVHPDRFAAGSSAEKRVAMQWATRANEAVRTLRSPVLRAIHLCALRGHPIDVEASAEIPAAFLQQQMEWREQLDDLGAEGNEEQRATLLKEVEAETRRAIDGLARALDETGDFAQAEALVRELLFIDKFRSGLEALGESSGESSHRQAATG